MKKIGKDGGVNYWHIGNDVWVTLSDELDHNKYPMGLRWECAFDHFQRFRDSAYKLVTEVGK
jgi:hypothetical protein